MNLKSGLLFMVLLSCFAASALAEGDHFYLIPEMSGQSRTSQADWDILQTLYPYFDRNIANDLCADAPLPRVNNGPRKNEKYMPELRMLEIENDTTDSNARQICGIAFVYYDAPVMIKGQLETIQIRNDCAYFKHSPEYSWCVSPSPDQRRHLKIDDISLDIPPAYGEGCSQ